jgi:uncharacterized protein (DUF58 family)
MLTSRGTATILLASILMIGGWVLSMPELFASGSALGGVVGLALVWVWIPTRKPTVDALASPNPAHASSTVTVTTTVHGKTVRPLLLTAAISDGRSVRLWTHTGRKTGQTGSFPLPVPVRGRLTVGPFRIFMLDPLGLAKRALSSSGSIDVQVRPRLHDCEPIPLSAAASQRDRVSDERPAQRRAVSGTEPAGLRQYVVGDELRLVHWTASARGRGLMVRTFDDETSVSTIVLLDDRQLVHSEESFELAVEIAASMLRAPSTFGEHHAEPTLVLWSDVLTERGGRPLTKNAALNRLVDIAPVAIKDRQHDFVPIVDVVITGALVTPQNELEITVAQQNVSRLIVDPEGLSHHRSISDPGQLERWTQFAQ